LKTDGIIVSTLRFLCIYIRQLFSSSMKSTFDASIHTKQYIRNPLRFDRVDAFA
jgi:hypothetical protein